ncbi:MAG: toprim domain-containing protein, partial [Candidatus Wildermuthbacteria bacterium]|nr:toprim domain-containing protein [Candidatus Wildermuthbacteria bacterium]
ALLKKNLNEDVIIRSGVCIRGEKGNVYDRFRGRVTFPIFNYFGEAVGFSARILPELDGPSAGSGQVVKAAKYINSPETLVYNKSRELFGLNFAKDEIRKKDEAVVVEGQLDCISAHQAGFTNTVASSGTALSALQLDALGRLTKNLKFCFDADLAGLKASRKAGEMALEKGFRLKVISLKAAKDPDELIKKSPGLWEKSVSEAIWFLDFYINLAKEKFPGDPVEQKHYLSSEVVPFLGFISDPLEQDHYIGELVKNFGISEKVIRGQVKNKGTSRTAPATESHPVQGQKVSVLEKEVLGGLMSFPEYLEAIKGVFDREDFEDPEIRSLAVSFFSGLGAKAGQGTALVKEATFMVESFLEQLGKEALIKRLLKSYCQLKLLALKKKQKTLQAEMAKAESRGEADSLRELQKEFASISNARMEWEKKLAA